MLSSLKFLYKYLQKDRWFILLIYLLGIFASTTILIRPKLIGSIVNEVATPLSTLIKNGSTSFDATLISKLWLLIGGILLITVCRGLSMYVYRMSCEKLSQNAMLALRKDMYSHLSELDFKFFDENRTGDIMTKMTGDTDMLRHFSAFTMFSIIENVVLFIGAAIAMFFVNVYLMLATLLAMPIIAIVAIKLSKAIHPTFLEARDRLSALNTMVQENIGGNRVVKAFAKEKYEMEKFEKVNEGFKIGQINVTKVWRKYLPILDFTTRSMGIISLLLGGILAAKKIISVGDIITFNGLLLTLTGPLGMSGWLISETERFSASAQRIMEFFNATPNVVSHDNAMEVERFKGSVEFKNVDFKYDNENVLTDISFRAESGETIAFVGPTGSGKSTIMNLICRFYDVSNGEILIDDVNVKKIDLANLRENISSAMQDIFLFSDTIEGNIAYGNPDATTNDVKRVAKVADAADFIQSLPDGYDTIVGERGVGLSGGQKQRIALARALLKNPSILILDDTTSSVDMKTEHNIHQTLKEYFNKRTTFIIAQRISSVKHADKIFVISDGQILEWGTHEDLINRPIEEAYYRNVFEHQMGDFDNFYKAGETNGKK